MDKIKVIYICRFSTPQIRARLSLSSLSFSNFLRKVAGKPKLEYRDSGTWNADFISAFENNPLFECTVISHHTGMKRSVQRFHLNGVKYLFLNTKDTLLQKIFKNIVYKKRVSNFVGDGVRINNYVKDINPNVVVICGAENSIYSSSALYIKDKPLFIILQTLLNSPKRLSMGFGKGEPEWLEFERRVLKCGQYYGSFIKEEAEIVSQINKNAHLLTLMFPSSVPAVTKNSSDKDYDFVFYANGLSKHKGTEDTLLAFSLVCGKHPQARMYVIGACEEGYKTHLQQLLQDKGIESNVTFHGSFPTKQDVITEVLRAKVAILPGITAPLNSTVREAMFLGMPTVVYDNSVIQLINKDKDCLIAAKMEDVDDLGKKMLYAYEHSSEVSQIGLNAKDYAYKTFSQEAVGETLRKEILAIVDHYYHQEPIPEDLLLI